jgi:peptidoglycan hydrolase-like protein with peptidoglycan-binding domain
MKKIDNRVWWALPILLGAYLIYRQFSKGSVQEVAPVAEIDKIYQDLNTKPTFSSTYPLKNGSRDTGSPLAPKGLVVVLQKLINTRGYIPSSSKLAPFTKLVEDGIFGKKTEEAVNYWTGKKSVDNESDLEALKDALVNKIPFSNVKTLF